MRHDHVDVACLTDHVGGDELGAGVRDPVRDQHEAPVVPEPGPADGMLVVIDPDRQAIAERVEERQRALLEVLAAGERHVDHRDAASSRRRRQLSRLLDEHHVHGGFLTL